MLRPRSSLASGVVSLTLAAALTGLGSSASASDGRDCPPPFQDVANLSTKIKDWAQFNSDEEVERCLTAIARKLGPDALTDWLNRSGLEAIRLTSVGRDVVYFTWMIKRQGGPLLHGTSFAWLKRWLAWAEAYSFRWEDSENVTVGRTYTYI